MNFYKRWIGDYRKKTARLTPLEHGVYNLLLDEHYATEEPLPLDMTEIYQIIGARKPADEAAVEKILGRYWVQTENGWTNERALEEMADFRDKSKKASGAAHKRWQGKRNADGCADALPPHVDRISDSDASQSQSQSQEPKPNPQPKPKSISAEALPRSALEVIRLPLSKAGDEAIITQDQVDDWAEAYPGIDVGQQLRNMRQWLIANPTRRKTRVGINRFIVAWLSKTQDSPRPPDGRGGGGGLRPVDNSDAAEEAIRRSEERERTIDG